MLKERVYFIAAIGTDIGKTYFVENICRFYKNALAIKPIASGFQINSKDSDTAKIISALKLDFSQKNIDSITPWRFEKPVSPHFAGEIDFYAVKDFCKSKIEEAKNKNLILFIEAAGGVMTPISNKKTFLDLFSEFDIPLLLLSANYLGSISHTLCTVEAIKSRNVQLEKIILNDNFPIGEKSSCTENFLVLKTLQDFAKIEVIMIDDFFKKISAAD